MYPKNLFLKKRIQINKYLFLPLILLLVNCSKNSEIEITKESISSSLWKNNLEDTQCVITRVYLDNNKLQFPFDQLSGFDVHNAVIRDKRGIEKSDFSFCSYKIPGKEQLDEISFTCENKDLIWISNQKPTIERKILGKLKSDAWYMFSQLRPNWLYYVYFDKTGTANIFSLMPKNM